MLTMTLRGKAIPVSRDFSMRVTWKSPATDFEKIPGGYGLGLSFPINEHTRALFGNPERFAKYRAVNDQKFPGFEVRFSGALLMAGTLSVTSFNKGNYEASLTDEIGVLGENEQERDILTFPAFTKDIPWVNSANYDRAIHPYCCFPIVNIKFFQEKGMEITIPKKTTTYVGEDGDTKKTEPAYDTEAFSYGFMKPPIMARVNALNGDKTVNCIAANFEVKDPDSIPVISVVSPFFFLQKVLTEALKSVEWHIIESAFDDSDILQQLCIYNNFDMTKSESSIVTLTKIGYTHIDQNGIEGPGEPNMEILQGYEVSEYQRSYPGTLKTKDYLPKMPLGRLILSTQNFLNLCFHFLPNRTLNIFSREKLLEGPAIDLEKYFIGTWDNGEKKDVALNFTHEVDDNDLIFSERYQDIEDRIEDVKEPVGDWTELMAVVDPKEGDIRYVKSSNNYLEFKLITIEDELGNKKDLLGWEEYSVGFQSGWYKRGRKEVEEIKTDWSTCYGNDVHTIVSQMGNMNSWKSKFQAFSPRLLVYKGNNAGGNESADFSLDYEKADKGVLPIFWKKWNPFWANRLPVTGSFDLPVNVLRHVIYNICRKYRTREGEFMIEEMSCDIYVDRIGETEVRGFKVE